MCPVYVLPISPVCTGGGQVLALIGSEILSMSCKRLERTVTVSRRTSVESIKYARAAF